MLRNRVREFKGRVRDRVREFKVSVRLSRMCSSFESIDSMASN